MNVTIKHISEKNLAEAEKYMNEKNLQQVLVLQFQFDLIPEGEYEIDLNSVFSNQYSTMLNNGKKYRIFEYCRRYSNDNSSLENAGTFGYYISNGIDELREYKKHVFNCHYCGKKYGDDHPEYCTSCVDSINLDENDYNLLKITNVNDPYYEGDIPDDVFESIKECQRKAFIAKNELEQANMIKELAEKQKDLIVEYSLRKLLFQNDFNYKELENLIYYSHSKKFCFGWQRSIGNIEKLRNRLNKIDGINEYAIEIK